MKLDGYVVKLSERLFCLHFDENNNILIDMHVDAV